MGHAREPVERVVQTTKAESIVVVATAPVLRPEEDGRRPRRDIREGINRLLGGVCHRFQARGPPRLPVGCGVLIEPPPNRDRSGRVGELRCAEHQLDGAPRAPPGQVGVRIPVHPAQCVGADVAEVPVRHRVGQGDVAEVSDPALRGDPCPRPEGDRGERQGAGRPPRATEPGPATPGSREPSRAAIHATGPARCLWTPAAPARSRRLVLSPSRSPDQNKPARLRTSVQSVPTAPTGMALNQSHARKTIRPDPTGITATAAEAPVS